MHVVGNSFLSVQQGGATQESAPSPSQEVNGTLHTNFLRIIRQRIGPQFVNAPIPLLVDLFQLQSALGVVPEADASLLSRCRSSSIGVVTQDSKEAGAILSQLQTPDGKYLLYGMDSSSTNSHSDIAVQVALSNVQGHTEVFESPTAHIEMFVRDRTKKQTLAASRCIIMTEDAFEESKGHARAFAGITRIVSEKSTDGCFRNLSIGSTVFSAVAETVKII